MRERTYLVLVHHPTLNPEGAVISSAITTLDLHDFSRLARTYGLGGVFAQTNLEQQMALNRRLLSHWVDCTGGEVNPHRREALGMLELVESVEAAARAVETRWGAPPLLTATSAKKDGARLGYLEARATLGETERPALILFGTSWGIAPELMQRCDWVLEPIGSPGDYNHLSVRSAASITVDRLFGES